MLFRSGLSYAYQSASAIAKALTRLDDSWQTRYRGLTRKMKLNIVLKLLKSRVMYSPSLRNLIFRLKIGSLDAD